MMGEPGAHRGRAERLDAVADRSEERADAVGEVAGLFTAAQLARPHPVVSPDTSCAEVLDLFLGRGDLAAVVVVENGRVMGLVDRTRITASFARPLMADLYSRRPIRLLMDPAPLIIDAAVSLTQIGMHITGDKPSALVTGFVITRDGAYLGMGTALDLMALTVEQAEFRARETEQALRLAEDASRAKTAFLANASHEIRTPLNAIMGFAELLAEEALGPLGNAVYRRFAGDIVDSGRHLMALINDLLDLSKAEADRLEVVDDVVDLNRTGAVCLRLIGERADRAQVALTGEIPINAPLLRADERKVRQMLLNLLSNAVKYTPPGGRIRLVAGPEADGGYRVAVCDTGIGMTQGELARALEPWERVDTAINRKLIGTGLGLPLTKRLIELHGGRMKTDSTPSEGTTMALIFPADRVLPPIGLTQS